LQTRPTPDRVREALFSILASEVVDASVLDLFAGSGALALEALSRGANRAVFVEADRRTALLLERNLEAVGGDGRVLAMPVARALDLLASEGQSFDLAFLDPPYDAGLLAPALSDVAARNLVGGWLIAEHRGSSEPPAAPPGWSRHDHRRFGDVAISMYRKTTNTDHKKGPTP
jgi:16S rRNA (guanine(966)-N(2))-methyltransferase RsmD